MILVVALLVAAVGSLVYISSKTHKSVSPLVFSRGALDKSGRFVESDTSLYTEELIQCRGLKVSVDFEASLTYEIYLYRADESLIDVLGPLSDDYELAESYNNAKYCRISMHPKLKNGQDKIRFWEVQSYAKQLKIEVAKDQEFEPPTSSIYPGVTEEHFTSLEDYYDYQYSLYIDENHSPFALKEIGAFSGRTITKIGVPVYLLKDSLSDSVLTLYVLEGNATTLYKVISEQKLTIPAFTYYNLDKFNSTDQGNNSMEKFNGYDVLCQWVYFDVNISLKEGQTLGFCKPDDSIVISGLALEDALLSNIYYDALKAPCLYFAKLIFDIYLMD